MKTTTIYRFLIVIAFTGVFASCNKSNSSNNSTTSSTDLQSSSNDVTQVSTETDAAIDDVNTAMSAHYTATGAATSREMEQRVLDGPGGNDSTIICDATVSIDTVSNPRTITITYNGANCSLDRTRTGSVIISWPEGQLWSTAGAVVTVQFDSLTITKVSNGKKTILNGTHTYTNVSGGSLASLAINQGGSITHTITSSNMSITFDNGSQRTWSVDRQRVFTYNGGYIITTTGLHTADSLTGISEWGLDRFGNAFTVDILQPRVISQACSWQMTSGEVALTNAGGVTTITYGLTSTGAAATGCPVGSSTYYFQLSWSSAASGKTYTVILPY
jgi:hypothetical protein